MSSALTRSSSLSITVAQPTEQVASKAATEQTQVATVNDIFVPADHARAPKGGDGSVSLWTTGVYHSVSKGMPLLVRGVQSLTGKQKSWGSKQVTGLQNITENVNGARGQGAYLREGGAAIFFTHVDALSDGQLINKLLKNLPKHRDGSRAMPIVVKRKGASVEGLIERAAAQIFVPVLNASQRAANFSQDLSSLTRLNAGLAGGRVVVIAPEGHTRTVGPVDKIFGTKAIEAVSLDTPIYHVGINYDVVSYDKPRAMLNINPAVNRVATTAEQRGLLQTAERNQLALSVPITLPGLIAHDLMSRGSAQGPQKLFANDIAHLVQTKIAAIKAGDVQASYDLNLDTEKLPQLAQTAWQSGVKSGLFGQDGTVHYAVLGAFQDVDADLGKPRERQSGFFKKNAFNFQGSRLNHQAMLDPALNAALQSR